jgi:hypothetical protein
MAYRHQIGFSVVIYPFIALLGKIKWVVEDFGHNGGGGGGKSNSHQSFSSINQHLLLFQSAES